MALSLVISRRSLVLNFSLASIINNLPSPVSSVLLWLHQPCYGALVSQTSAAPRQPSHPPQVHCQRSTSGSSTTAASPALPRIYSPAPDPHAPASLTRCRAPLRVSPQDSSHLAYSASCLKLWINHNFCTSSGCLSAFGSPSCLRSNSFYRKQKCTAILNSAPSNSLERNVSLFDEMLFVKHVFIKTDWFNTSVLTSSYFFCKRCLLFTNTICYPRRYVN